MIALLVGTRPEIIKMAPVMRELKRCKVPFLFIHSNQHYSEEMDALILKDLDLPAPDIHLKVGSSSHATQTGKIMVGMEKACLKYKPQIVLVHGDTNTTMAGALAAKKLHIPVAHIEAGLRSFDYNMPEEINRIITDRISDIMFSPSETAKENLIKEGMPAMHIVVTGNTVVDALIQNTDLAKKSQVLKLYGLKKDSYILVTIHRAENTDDEKTFVSVLELLKHAHKKLNQKIVWPLHPRTRALLESKKIVLPEFILTVPSLGYIDMLAIMNSASLIMTDSGGLQEEAYILHRPLMTLRTSTERPETLSANFIIGSDKLKFNAAWKAFQKNKVSWSNTLGNGDAAKKIVETIQLYLQGL